MSDDDLFIFIWMFRYCGIYSAIKLSNQLSVGENLILFCFQVRKIIFLIPDEVELKMKNISSLTLKARTTSLKYIAVDPKFLIVKNPNIKKSNLNRKISLKTPQTTPIAAVYRWKGVGQLQCHNVSQMFISYLGHCGNLGSALYLLIMFGSIWLPI